VVVWGKRAEALAKILHKGSSLFVEGSIRTSSFEGRDGQKKWKTEINARNILLTGGGGRRSADDGGRQFAQEPSTAPPEYDDANAPNFAPDDDDDIPF
jgi:single-strand DNA-binding protein